MIIESLSIVDFKDKTATSYDFSDGTNLIVSTGNKKGKSSLLKSIYYTLGFDIRQFPSGWNISNKVFQLKVKFDDGISHTVTRQSDIYKVDADDTPLNSKEYSEWLQITLGIDMKLPNKQSKKLHSVYSTALLSIKMTLGTVYYIAGYQIHWDNIVMYPKGFLNIFFQYQILKCKNYRTK